MLYLEETMRPWTRKKRRENKKKERRRKKKSIRTFHNMIPRWAIRPQCILEMKRQTIVAKIKSLQVSKFTTHQEENQTFN